MSAAGTAGPATTDPHLAMPGAFTDETEATDPSTPSIELTDVTPAMDSELDSNDGVERITVRELIEDVASDTIREHTTALEHKLIQCMDLHINLAFASTDTTMKEFMRVMKGIFDGGLGLAERRMRDAILSECHENPAVIRPF